MWVGTCRSQYPDKLLHNVVGVGGALYGGGGGICRSQYPDKILYSGAGALNKVYGEGKTYPNKFRNRLSFQ